MDGTARSAQPKMGCARRAALGVAVSLIIGACGVSVTLNLAMRSPAGRYYVGVGLLVAGMNESAERVTAELVKQRPSSKAAYYSLLAAAQRRQGRVEEQLATFDAATKALPTSWNANSDRCWYGALFDAPAAVLDSCQTAIDTAENQRELGVSYARQAVALARSGDIESGSLAMDRAFTAWTASGIDVGQLSRPWTFWSEELSAGRDPFNLRTLETERQRF